MAVCRLDQKPRKVERRLRKHILSTAEDQKDLLNSEKIWAQLRVIERRMRMDGPI